MAMPFATRTTSSGVVALQCWLCYQHNAALQWAGSGVLFGEPDKQAMFAKHVPMASSPRAVRFSFDSASTDHLITHSSAAGSIVLSPSKASNQPESSNEQPTNTTLPPADLDFGMLKEGHCWQASACAVPEGSAIENVKHGSIVKGVEVGWPSAVVAEHEDCTLDAPSRLACQHAQQVLITVKPEGAGPFSDVVEFDLVSAVGGREVLQVQVHGTVMRLATGTPQVRTGVHCLDSSA